MSAYLNYRCTSACGVSNDHMSTYLNYRCTSACGVSNDHMSTWKWLERISNFLTFSPPDPSFRCNATEIRLGGGATSNEGRVEICLDNHWGTLCDNGWDEADAQVVCRQLGFRSDGEWAV